MNASELLRSLEEEGVQLWREGEELRYRAPKGLVSAELIDALAARKQAIIRLLQHRSVAGACFQTWKSSEPESQDVFPLSFAQRRMWFLKQLELDSCSLNVALAFSLNGRLDIPALERSLGELIDRHEALRTTCDINDGQPLQIIKPAGGTRMALEIVDLRTIAKPEQESELERLITLEARRPFALDRSPLLDATLLQLAEDRHALLLTTHHFVVDGWSVGVMLRDLSVLYDANSNGRPSSLETLRSRYCDYAIWQRERLKGELLEELLGYWKGKLGGAAELNLPTDRPMSVSPSGRGATHRFDLPSGLSDALKALSRREGVTLFTTLLTAFKALLCRYSGQNDIVVGTAVSDRCMVETQTLVGCFANTLVLRTLCDGDPTFRQLLRRVHDTAIEAFDHQEMPFDMLVEHLRPERFHVRNPLFRVSFLLHQHADDHSLKLTGLKVQRLPIDLGTSRFDLLLEFQNQEEQLSGLLEFSTDLFDPATIERMERHFQVLLEGMVREPDRPVARVSMLTEAEVGQVLRDWNQTASPYPAQRCVHEQFERHARLQPDAPAVVAEGGTLSYGELDRRSEQLAEYLRGEGVSVGTPVALGMDRSLEMIVGMLAVLKAGGVYVPLDPAYPAERLGFLLNEVEASLMLTVEEVASCFPPTAAKVICLDRDWSLIEGHAAPIRSRTEASTTASSHDLAYVIFTSGSTGAPKGVAVPHRAITRLVLNTNYLNIGPQDRIAHLSNVCFDAATFEIWGALLNGGCIVLVPKAVALDPQRFAVELQRHKVSALFLTTALFNELAATNDRIFQGVNQVLFGGEAVNPEPVRRVLEGGGPPGRLLHVYGPTECTTFAAFYPVTHVEKEAATIPIGRPISNTTAYVLDKHGNPLPVGVPGELYLGGPGVAQGYLNQPELTRESFLADPFAADSTQRLYRTGDIVKYLPDGNIEFIGRADGQVKIRGFRIEPGEVEAVLKRHPELEDCAIVVREDEPGERRLVAYIVTQQQESSNDWAGFLRQKLPEYMIPSAFVVLDKLPLTPNGKIDRRALPAPERPVIEAYRTPRTPQEEILCDIFSDVLSVETIGIDDNFFELGGHSLLASRVISQLRACLGIGVPLRDFFDNPTIRKLAEFVENSHGTGQITPSRSPNGGLPEEVLF